MKRSELQRRTPLAKKRAKPRRKPAARCDYSTRCKRRPSVVISADERMCSTHATWTADKLVGDFVRRRDGRCMLVDFNANPCYEPATLYWAHLIPKGRYPQGRYIATNAVAACLRHHESFDHSPLEKDEWIVAHLGTDTYEWLRRAVRSPQRPVAEVIFDYRLRAAAA